MSKGLAFLKSAAVALAMVGVVFPQTRILADQKAPAKPVIKTVAANSILDVSLGKDGTFTGRAVTQNGSPVEGATVVLKQANTEVAHSVTDANGQFAMSNLKSGVYQVKAGNTDGSFRLWAEQIAPPTAKPYGLLVMGEKGARGQIGCYDDCGGMWLCGLLGVAALGVGVAALVIANNAQSDANSAAAISAANRAALIKAGLISP